MKSKNYVRECVDYRRDKARQVKEIREKRDYAIKHINFVSKSAIEAKTKKLIQKSFDESEKILKKTKKYEKAEKVNEILRDLRRCVSVDRNVEMFWKMWSIFHINLPAIWKFEWFKYDFFKSKFEFSRWPLESQPDVQENLCSMVDICSLLEAFKNYLQESHWLVLDKNIDFKKDLSHWNTENCECETWYFVKEILDLYSIYFLKDSYKWEEWSRVIFCCDDDMCAFDYSWAVSSFENYYLRWHHLYKI